jgi:hypothetical protein
MAATTTNHFPLATETYADPGSDGLSTIGGSDAGASGSSPGAVEISRGGMIAIIVVVSVVGLFGSKASPLVLYLGRSPSQDMGC